MGLLYDLQMLIGYRDIFCVIIGLKQYCGETNRSHTGNVGYYTSPQPGFACRHKTMEKQLVLKEDYFDFLWSSPNWFWAAGSKPRKLIRQRSSAWTKKGLAHKGAG